MLLCRTSRNCNPIYYLGCSGRPLPPGRDTVTIPFMQGMLGEPVAAQESSRSKSPHIDFALEGVLIPPPIYSLVRIDPTFCNPRPPAHHNGSILDFEPSMTPILKINELTGNSGPARNTSNGGARPLAPTFEIIGKPCAVIDNLEVPRPYEGTARYA